MQVAVVMVNYGQWELTRRALDSLRASSGVDLSMTLVDNCSPGGVPRWVGELEDIRFRRLPENVGFAGGNNAGFSLSEEDDAEYTFFLNNDAMVEPGTVAALADFLREHGEAGVAAPAVYLASDRSNLWSAGGNLTRWRMRFRRPDLEEDLFLKGRGMDVDFVSGCALMIRSGLFRELGGFREDFFMYYEDAEFCWRAREAGRRVMVVPSAAVYHDVASGSGGELSKLALYFSERNRLVLSGEMLGPLERSAFILYRTLVLPVQTLRFILMRKTGLIPWIWRAHLDGLAGRTGYSGILEKLGHGPQSSGTAGEVGS
jgi:GT2 family glycosyltransferase